MRPSRDFLHRRVISPIILGLMFLVLTPLLTFKYHGWVSVAFGAGCAAVMFGLAYWGWRIYQKEEQEQRQKDQKIAEMEAEIRRLKDKGKKR